MWVAGKNCDPLVIHGLYPSALEMQHDKSIHVTLHTFKSVVLVRKVSNVNVSVNFDLYRHKREI